MDHPLTAPDTLVRPWRTAAYIAGAIAVAELLLLLVIGGGALVRAVSDRIQLAAHESVVATPAATTARPAAVKPKVAPTPVAKRPRAKTVVLVLNGNGRSGAASAAATRVRSRGYPIGGVGNAQRSDYRQSLVMYRPGYAGEGQRLGRDLGVKMVGPLDGMRAGALGKAHVLFILGS
ncbi:MAG: LytR C-terminal domain-containing protein [Gaiellaceae bacterium]